MNRRYRKTVIAGNWKMNMTATETKKFAEDLKKIMPRAKWCDTLICVPACNISTAMKAFKDLRISVGAENVYFEEKGAYTGEVSADMLKDLGVKYVIVGHSERRQYFCETDQTVNKKVHAVLNAGMNPIICVGESLEQRETGITNEWIALQVKSALNDVPAEKLRRCIIAYEPIWAIGTGKAKMSKSLGNCIYLSDEPEDIRKKIMSMYTDPDHIRIEDPGKLEGNTVFTYLDAFCKDELFAEYLPDYSCLQELKDHYTRGGLGDVKVKKFLYSVIMEELSPIQARRKELEKDIPAVMEILHKGSIKAKEVAAGTLSEVKHAMKIDYFD